MSRHSEGVAEESAYPRPRNHLRARSLSLAGRTKASVPYTFLSSLRHLVATTSLRYTSRDFHPTPWSPPCVSALVGLCVFSSCSRASSLPWLKTRKKTRARKGPTG